MTAQHMRGMAAKVNKEVNRHAIEGEYLLEGVIIDCEYQS